MRDESMPDIYKILAQSRKRILIPPTKMSLVEWADEYRVLSPESSSEPGRFKTSRVEVARGPMLAVTDPKVREITVVCCTQLMKTELLNNIVGFFIHQDPAPLIVMQPNEKLGKAWSQDRLDKMIRDTPVLQDKVKDKKSRDSENTISHKSFPGGHVTVVGSNAPGDLAMRPVRVVLCDEVDKYPPSAGKEGDPISLIRERAATFWNYLIVKVCSPTIEGRSRIQQEYDNSDQRKFHVPCPHCGVADEMRWDHVKWEEGAPRDAKYHCPSCEKPWSEPERIKALSSGTWVATAPFNGHAGFHVTKLSSPWETLGTLVVKFLEAKKSPETLKAFVNTQLAETWKEKGDAPEWERLYRQREKYKIGTVPIRGLFLTCGVDVQGDRIEYEVVAWGRGKESWSVEYGVIMGQTNTDMPWIKLAEVLDHQYEHERGGMLPIRMMAVDSGHNTQHVYNWVRRFPPNRVIAIKGDKLQIIVGIPKAADVNMNGQKSRRGLRIWPIGVGTVKSELYSWLKLEPPLHEEESFPAGFCHFPEYDEEYFKMLTAEQLVKVMHKGYARYEWTKFRDRNESLDTRVYARAAASIVGLDRYKENNFDDLERQLIDSPKTDSPAQSQVQSGGIERKKSPYW